MTNKEEIDNKILQLKNSVKKITVLCETLNSLIPESDLNELLKIEFAAERLGTQAFGIIKKVEENAFNRLQTIYP